MTSDVELFRSVGRPIPLAVDCEGAEHEIVWHRGNVVLTNHPDLDAELAMVALGGTEPTCLSYLKSWNAAIADGGFLAEWVEDTGLTTAWLSWLDMALERMRVEGFHEVLRSLPPARSLQMGDFIHRFPLPWLDRAAAEVSASLASEARVICDDAPGHLDAATSVRLRRSFVTSVGGRQMPIGAAALVPLDIAIRPGPPAIGGTIVGPNRRVSLDVDRSWLHKVWAPDAATIDGQLVLALTPGDAPIEARAAAVRWQDGEPTLSTFAVTHDGTTWRRS